MGKVFFGGRGVLELEAFFNLNIYRLYIEYKRTVVDGPLLIVG